MPDYILGIDAGSTFCKAAIFTETGDTVAVAGQPLAVQSPCEGRRELDPDHLWSTAAAAIKASLSKAGIDAKAISSIGLTGAGNGGYYFDKAMRPVRPGILSSDGRAASLMQEWNGSEAAKRAFSISLMTKHPGETSTIALWLKRNEPEAYATIAHLLMAKDYIRYRLTGVIATDFTDMCSIAVVEQDGRKPLKYSTELLSLYGVPEIESALAPMHESTSVVSKVSKEAAALTGLTEGTPVVAGSSDSCASTFGSGAVNPGDLNVIAGTWGINVFVRKEVVGDPRILWTHYLGIPGLYQSAGGSPASATNLEWFVNELCDSERSEAKTRNVSAYDICGEEIAQTRLSPTNPFFHPFLHGSTVQPSARAGFYGLGGWHRKADLLRAVFEGVAFSHTSEIGILRDCGLKIETVRLSGGAARSPIWGQMFADVLNLPILIPASDEVGAHGAALFGALGTGIYADAADAVAKSVRVQRSYQPDPAAVAIYQARFREYRNLIEAMREPWNRLAALA